MRIMLNNTNLKWVVYLFAFIVFVMLLPSYATSAQSELAGSISGRITELGGEPVTTGGVCAATFPGEGTCVGVNSDGSYLIEPLAPGVYTVGWDGDPAYARMAYPHNLIMDLSGAEENIWGPPAVTVSPGEVITEIDLELEPGGTIRGTVYDSVTMEPIQGSVYLMWIGEALYAESDTDEDGIFEVASMPQGVEIKVTAVGGGDTVPHMGEWWEEAPDIDQATPIVLTPANTYEEITFTLDPMGAISGQITDQATGEPVTTGGVCAATFPGEGTCVGVNSDGSYLIEPLAPGVYTVGWDGDPAYARMAYPHNLIMDLSGAEENIWGPPAVTVSPGEVITEIDLELEPGGTIRGTVYDSVTMEPIQGSVYLMWIGEALYAESDTDEDGIFEVASMPQGVEIKVTAVGGGDTVPHMGEWWEEAPDIDQATPIVLTPANTYEEITFTLDPDSDNDGLSDLYEVQIGTNPLDPDTDGDTVEDGVDACPVEDATGFDADLDGCIDTPNGLAQIIETLPEDVLSDEVENSIASKVENAIKSVDKDANEAAIGQLEAFINQVEAQRGKKISEDAADLLVAYAQNIIASIFGG